MWAMKKFLSAIILATAIQISCQYKPVFLFHGVLVGSSFMDYLAERIIQAHPGTIIYNSNAYPYVASLVPLPDQISGELGREFLNFSAANPDGFHFVAHSQGALLGRALLETYSEHTVQNYISLAGPMAGQFGLSTLGNIPLPYHAGSLVFYNTFVQHSLSIANFWNDPNKHDLYLKTNIFLPYINNELPSSLSETYKEGFTKIRNLVCVGGPQDGVITPYQSSFFSFVDANGTIINYRERDLYRDDSFGLRTLDETGRYHTFEKSGVEHLQWPKNDDVIDRFVLPF